MDETSPPRTRGSLKKQKGQPPKDSPNATPAYMRKAIRQICEPKVNMISKKVKETPTLKMEYRNKKPDSHASPRPMRKRA